MSVRLGAAPLLWGTLNAAAPLWSAADVGPRLLAVHNAERSRLGIPPLHWNARLAARATEWADELAEVEQLDHADEADYDDGSIVEGENMWRGTKGSFTPEQMAGLWIDERRIFVNGPFPKNATNGRWRDVGHYTQIVWRSTTQLGCGIAEGVEDEILVCRYVEGGNVIGERPF